ncbi:MAG: LysR family transcriptional regulator [Planctomycetota bacterium]
MDRLQSMRVFARVIDEGSFAGAARALNLSPTVATRLVADLEDHLRARLVNRTTRRLALTDTGESYLERVRHILAEIDDAEALAGAATSEPRGVVRVLCPPAFAVHQLAPRLPEFGARFPKVTIDLSAPGPVSTMDENFDLSILLVGPQKLEGEFVARLLAQSAWIVCASPEYLDRHGRPRRLRDFIDHQVLAPLNVREVLFHPDTQRRPGARGRTATPAAPQTVALDPVRGTLGTNHIDTLYAAARAGLGIAGLPSFVVHPALQDGTLERVLLDWHMAEAQIYVAMPTRKYVPARTRALWNFLLEAFGGEAKDPWLARLRPVDRPQRRR